MHEKWMEKPAYREAHEALEEEFALAAAVIDARLRLPHAEISEIRMHGPDLLGPSAMAREPSDLVGRRVDVAVKAALKPRIRLGEYLGPVPIHTACLPEEALLSRPPF